MSENDKCITCKLKVALERAIDEAEKAQEYYLEQVKKVNETLAKYSKKLEELGK
jgi:hypothetical protein